MTKYLVKYFYLATGMDGKADKRDYGIFEAKTPADAIEKVVVAEYPVDKMYGPNNSYSTRDFFRGCLTATEIGRLQKTCTAQQLIERLRKFVEQHGDLLVYADDADTGFRLPIGLVHKPADAEEEWPERLEIKTDYHGRPKGDF